MVADAAAGVEGVAVAVGHLARQPRPGPERTDVVGRAVALLALQPVAADAAVHEVRVAGDGGVRLEVELVERVGAQVADEHVGRRQQVLEVRAVGRRRAGRATTLRLPRLSSANAGLGMSSSMPSEPNTLRIGSPRRRLDLDDVGAPVGEQRGRRRAPPPTRRARRPAGRRRTTDRAGACRGRRSCATTCGRALRGARARSSSFITLPVALSGSSSTISHPARHLVVGHLLAAPRDDLVGR